MKHIFFDVDGCLIDTSYNFTIDEAEVKQKVSDIISEGTTIHINSNRSIENLLEIYKRVGMNGVIITENGIGVYNPQTGNNIESKSFNPLNRDLLSSTLDSNIRFIDTGTLVNYPIKFLEELGENQIAFFAEDTRKFTMTVYPRQKIRNNLVFDNTLLDKTVERLKIYFKDFDISAGPNYGNVLLVPKDAKKGMMIPEIVESGYIVSFGDSKPDISMFEYSDFCGAPSNADDEVKKEVRLRGGYVSSKPYTEGALDFLQKVQNE